MKIFLIPLLLICGACTAAKPRVDLMAGLRDFDSRGDWEQTDQQGAIGIQASFVEPNGFGPEVAFIHSDDVSHDEIYVNRAVNFTESSIDELSIGLRKNFTLGTSFQFDVSGGVSATMLQTDTDLVWGTTLRDRSVAYAPYVQAGVSYFFTPNYSLGVMYRRSFWGEDADAFVNDPETDSDLFMLTVGYSF